ncbi:MAG: integrin alpha, partial [Pseudomonadota bacterium]
MSGLIALILIAILGLWILGRQQPSQKLSGHTRVVFLSLKHQDPGFVRRTNFGGDEAGSSLSGGYDFNDDGAIDLVIAAPRANGSSTREGAVYVVYG